MDPLTMMALISLGGQVVNHFTSGDGAVTGQTRESFSGPTNAALLGQANEYAQGLGHAITERARQPIRLRGAVARTPGGTKAGGGMPMRIGLSGRDPAASDASLLEMPGLDLPNLPGGSGGGSTSTGHGPYQYGSEQPDRPIRLTDPSPTGGGQESPSQMPPPMPSSGGGGLADAAPSNMSDAEEIMRMLQMAGGGMGDSGVSLYDSMNKNPYNLEEGMFW